MMRALGSNKYHFITWIFSYPSLKTVCYLFIRLDFRPNARESHVSQGQHGLPEDRTMDSRPAVSLSGGSLRNSSWSGHMFLCSLSDRTGEEEELDPLGWVRWRWGDALLFWCDVHVRETQGGEGRKRRRRRRKRCRQQKERVSMQMDFLIGKFFLINILKFLRIFFFFSWERLRGGPVQ